MRFIKATIFTLLTSSAAVLGAPDCDENPQINIADAHSVASNLLSSNENDAIPTEEMFYSGVSGSAQVRRVAVGTQHTSADISDIYNTVQEIADTCNKDGYTGGSSFVHGNGYFLVKLVKNS